MQPSHAESIRSDGEYGVFEGSIHDEVVHGHYRREGTWSPEIQALLANQLFPEGRGTFLDVGANIGLVETRGRVGFTQRLQFRSKRQQSRHAGTFARDNGFIYRRRLLYRFRHWLWLDNRLWFRWYFSDYFGLFRYRFRLGLRLDNRWGRRRRLLFEHEPSEARRNLLDLRLVHLRRWQKREQ